MIQNSHGDTEKQNNALKNSLDKIMIAHRNTKLFLFFMSWQFFAVYYIGKKIAQLFLCYYLYKIGKLDMLQNVWPFNLIIEKLN